MDIIGKKRADTGGHWCFVSLMLGGFLADIKKMLGYDIIIWWWYCFCWLFMTPAIITVSN